MMAKTKTAPIKIGLFAVLLVFAVSCADEAMPADDPYADFRVRHGETCVEYGTTNIRCWDVFVPSSMRGGAVPLVIDFHPLNSTPAEQRAQSGLDELARAENFIVAYPYGLGRSWNAGDCCEPASADNIDDVGFIGLLAVRMQKDYGIDLARVYATGSAHGCAMAQHLANQSPELVAEVFCGQISPGTVR